MTASPSYAPCATRTLLALAAACAAGAALLAGNPANAAWFEAYNAFADRLLPDAVLGGWTILGDGLCVLMLAAAALPAAPRTAAAALLATPIAALLTHVPKRLLAEARPAAVLDGLRIHVHGVRLAGVNSFPSGHSLAAFAIAAVFVCALCTGAPDARPGPAASRRAEPRHALAAALVLAAAAVVASSRIAVGAHWPDDVFAGAALGLVAGVAGFAWATRWRFWERRAGRLAMAAVYGGCAVALLRFDTGYPAALPFQQLLAAGGFAAAALGLRAALRTGAAEHG